MSSKEKEPQVIRAECRAEISSNKDKKQEPSMKALLKTSSNPVKKKEKTPLKKSVTKKAIPQQPQRDL